jgi:hypothetical protein
LLRGSQRICSSASWLLFAATRHTSRKRWRQEEQLQQQAGVQLDLKEDNGKQRDVDSAQMHSC